MRRHVAPVVFLLVASVPAAAQQGRWQEIGKTSQGNPIFLDQRSRSTKDGILTATLRTVFVKPVKSPKGDLTSTRTTAMFDCAKGTYAVKENIIYHDEKAQKVFDRRAPKIPGYMKPITGSLPDVAMAKLCAK